MPAPGQSRPLETARILCAPHCFCWVSSRTSAWGPESSIPHPCGKRLEGSVSQQSSTILPEMQQSSEPSQPVK